jgi:hypothetical protein
MALVFCYTSAFYIEKKHFAVAISGPLLIFASCFVEGRFFSYISYYWSANPIFLESLIFLQFLVSLASVILVFKDRKNFT